MSVAFRDIAVFLDASPAGQAIGRHAARLAARHQAHLVGIFGATRDAGRDRTQSHVRGPEAIRDVIAQRRQENELRALEAGRCVGALTDEFGISSEFRVVAGNGPELDAALRSLHCDLLVATKPSAGALAPWSPEQLWLDTGIPLLLVPQAWQGSSIGENVLIAWNRSRQARRAVGDALPFLEKADRTTVLVVDGARNPLHFGEAPGANLAQYLGRHGMRVELDQVESDGEPVAEVILQKAETLGADLLVIGGYSRSRTTERLFGGTTRTLLSETRLPMLLSG